MRIKSIELKNFKRFTELVIKGIPEQAKLVLLIGANGSGKSSLFDAFDWLPKGIYKPFGYGDANTFDYYRKDFSNNPWGLIEFYDGQKIVKDGVALAVGNELAKKFIGRSSIRIVPRIFNSANPQLVESDRDSPLSYIENDTRFINDLFLYIQKINHALREPVFRGKQADTLKIFRDFIEPLNKSLLKIFGGDETVTIQIAEFQDATPNSPAKLIFTKGKSNINYDLLSHGEKQIVILLINFIVRQEFYQDSIIFIDEMDNHLNTSLQYAALEEIVTNWIPNSSQLWTASHALGFIDYARKSEIASILDFDLRNFDDVQEIIPEPKQSMDVYEIAIPKSTIASILRGYKLVVVENTNDKYFNAALGRDGYLFLPANHNREVFLTIKGDNGKSGLKGLRDRDYLRDDEIKQIEQKMPNLKILKLSAFENYVYHPDNIEELNITGFDRQAYFNEILRQKNEKLIDIVGEIGTARTHYIEFKDCITNNGDIRPITSALQSSEFDEYYPFFSMKKHFNKQFLSAFNLTVERLASTGWFKNQIQMTLSE